VRDYVNDTGTLTTLEGKDAHGVYFQAFFDKYEVRSVEPLYRAAEEWYIFAEVRITASLKGRSAGDRTVSFHTAEFHMPANDGRSIAGLGPGPARGASGGTAPQRLTGTAELNRPHFLRVRLPAELTDLLGQGLGDGADREILPEFHIRAESAGDQDVRLLVQT